MMQLIKENVHDIDPSAEIWLFGSRARKEARSDSDWDLLVLTHAETVSHADENMFIDHLSSLMIETGQVVQVLVYSLKEWHTKYSIIPLYRSIKEEGVKL